MYNIVSLNYQHPNLNELKIVLLIIIIDWLIERWTSWLSRACRKSPSKANCILERARWSRAWSPFRGYVRLICVLKYQLVHLLLKAKLNFSLLTPSRPQASGYRKILIKRERVIVSFSRPFFACAAWGAHARARQGPFKALPRRLLIANWKLQLLPFLEHLPYSATVITFFFVFEFSLSRVSVDSVFGKFRAEKSSVGVVCDRLWSRLF